MARVFQRAISPIEWMSLASPNTAAMTIQLFVEGTGSLDAAALESAAATAADALPGTRLVRRGRLWVDSGRAPRGAPAQWCGAGPGVDGGAGSGAAAEG